jgi:hypothetical protein
MKKAFTSFFRVFGVLFNIYLDKWQSSAPGLGSGYNINSYNYF